MNKYDPGTHRLYCDIATDDDLIIPAGTILVIPSEQEQEMWRGFKAPAVSSEG